MPTLHRVVFTILLLGALAPAAWAQDDACPAGNLLAGKRPARSEGATLVARLTDDVAAAEGDSWNTNATGILASSKAFVVFDLGREVTVRALLMQGDNNDTYDFSTSLDGQAFTPLWTAPMHPLPGMRLRLTQGLDAHARYLRVGDAKGDDAFSLGEVQAFCQQPALWPPALTLIEGKVKGDARTARLHRLARQKIVVAVMAALLFVGLLLARREQDRWVRWLVPVAGAAIVVFGAWCAWGGVGVAYGVGAVLVAVAVVHRAVGAGRDRWTWIERAALIGAVAVSIFGWTNFGTWHGGRGVHYHEQFHYMVGSKYFAEVGYDLLYHCTAVAQDEDGHREELLGKKVRVLATNVLLGSAKAIIDNPEPCRAKFSPQRWAAFKQDVRLFRSQMGLSGIERFYTDHGYNASPAWNMVGGWIANRGWESKIPPSEMVYTNPNLAGKTAAERGSMRARWEKDKERFIGEARHFAQIDGVLYLAILGLIAWAFGLRALALACVIWYIGHPWSFYWTGGGYARAPWLFMAVAGMCFMKKGMSALGGFGITWSMLLRVFPGALIGGVVARIAWGVIKERHISKAHRRLILGCVAAVVLLAGVPLAVPSSGGGDYKGFLHNSMKHKETGLTNHMGMPTLFAFKPSYLGRKVRNNAEDDPWAVWKQKRHEVLQARTIPFAAAVLGLFLLVGYVGRRREDWEVTAMSTVFIVAGFQLTCYYYIFCIMLAPLALQRLRYVIAILAMCVATQLVHLAGGWIDEMYLKESALVMAAYLYLLGDMAWETWQAEKAARAVSPGAASPEAGSSEGAAPDLGAAAPG